VNFVKEEVQNNNNLKVIIAGDFNSYQKTVGPEQIKTINDALLDDAPLLSEASDKLFLPTGTLMPINNTFISFPYDIFACDPNSPNKDKIDAAVTSFPSFELAERKKAINKAFEELGDACSGQLDHIFTHNFSKIGECIVKVAPQFAPPPEVYDEKHVKAYILDHLDDGPAFPSDHQPLVTELLGQEAGY
jgi:endonuclease/exonuclease/phosphatase family metal-dependent hydrolase